MIGHRLRHGIGQLLHVHHRTFDNTLPISQYVLDQQQRLLCAHTHTPLQKQITSIHHCSTPRGRPLWTPPPNQQRHQHTKATATRNNNNNNKKSIRGILPVTRGTPDTTNATTTTTTTASVFPPPPPRPAEYPIWTDEIYASPLDLPRRIFCNRTLNMKSIIAVGFDMDYTLASYKPDGFETLAHNQTVDKLVKYFGYPPLLYDIEFDWRYMTRGLVIDKQRGNVIKVDRHKYVKLAYHGFQELDRDERMATYNAGQGQEFDEPQYALIDTLFSLAEAYLFMSLVEIADQDPRSIPPGKNYAALYRDVRGAVDLCHRDGSIKREIAKHPDKYIHGDPALVTVLQMLRRSGKKVFLATNSLWDYTSVVMNWVIGGKRGAERDDSWLELFDVIVTGCGKPRFFTERKDLFEVHPATGMLWNTEGGSPMIPIGEADLPTPELGSTAPARVDEEDGRTRVFQGGCFMDLHKMLGVSAGSQVLYVGDHIYGDVLRSKKDLGWRTMLVIPELENELNMLRTCKMNMTELKILRNSRDALDDQIQRLEWRLKGISVLQKERVFMSEDDDDVGQGVRGGVDDCGGNGGSSGESDEVAAVVLDESTNESSGINGEYNNKSNSHPHAMNNSIFSGTTTTTMSSSSSVEMEELLELLSNLKEQRDILKERHRALLKSHHEAFHPVWGQLFKTGYQNSRYAHQVERFACLYTSHVSNMMFYSPLKSYKAQVDSMAHEEEQPKGE